MVLAANSRYPMLFYASCSDAAPIISLELCLAFLKKRHGALICSNASGLESCLGASADDLPFDDGRTDLILSNFLLYAWIQDEGMLESIYREFHRVLIDRGEVRIYPAPELDVDRIGHAGLRDIMNEFEISQRFSARWLNLAQYPPAYMMTMRKK